MSKDKILEGKRVLIVDDEPDVLDTLEGLLPMCRIERAATFEEARDKMETQPFDLTILDIMGVDGYRLLQLANRKTVIAIMLTAHAFSPDNLIKSYKEGAVSYVPKERIGNIHDLLIDILENVEKGKDFLWECWLEQIDTLLKARFGPDWKDRDKDFKEKFKSPK